MLTNRDLQLLEEAITQNTVVKFGYRGSDDSFSMRRVEPMEIKNGMLWAWDTAKESTRSFKLERMQGLMVTNQEFDPRRF